MEVQSDHGLLVVSLENCITSDTTCELAKSNNCVYSAAMSSGAYGHEAPLVQLATPVQCIGQPLQRLQHQHVTQLQPIQYSQTLNYEPNQPMQHTSLVSNPTLYQPMSVATTPHLPYTTANPTMHNPYINNPPLSVLTPSPSFPAAPGIDDLTSAEQDTAAVDRSEELSEPTYPAEGFDYFLEIQNYLVSQQCPPNVSDNYNKCLKRRAQNYLMIDGKLYHNRKQPKEVIMRKDQQEDMLSDIHVVKETGIHLGVKKMFNKLHMKYFWRGMYTDVVNFVKKCDKCSDQQDVVQRGKFVARTSECKGQLEEEDSEEVEDPAPLSPCSNSSLKTSSKAASDSHLRVWKKVEVQMHGPFKKTCNRNEFILTMTDPVSQWCCATAVPTSGLPTHLVEFIFHSFCNYGFARCFLVDCSKDLYDAVSEEYVSRVTSLGEVFSSATIERFDTQQSACGWVQPMLDRLVAAHPARWDKHLDHFLFQYRIGELRESSSFSTESPFSVMFNHNPLGFTSPEEDKENIDGNNPGYHLRSRRPHTIFMKCKHCNILFTSKLSFRIHQRKHLGEASHRRHLLGRKRLKKIKRVGEDLGSQGEIKPTDSWKESTVSAVKALLQATREERRRRGKYHKYTAELQEQIATYAVKHGNLQAVRYFSERLGTMVSESTVRNMVKIHNAFTPAVKDEIGRYAADFGVEAAAKMFSEWLKRDVSQFLVRKFKTIYLRKRPENEKQQQERHLKVNQEKKCVSENKQSDDNCLRGKRYTAKEKEEIGKYACNHSLQDTAQYFSTKLNMLVKERTVKRFYKLYLDKCHNQNNQQISPEESLEMESVNDRNQMVQVNAYNSYQPIQNTPVTLYQLSEPSNAMCYQTTPVPSVITSQNYSTVQNFTTLTQPHHPPPSYPVALVRTVDKTLVTNFSVQPQNQQTQTCLLPQHSLLVTEDRNNSLLSQLIASQPLQQTILTIVPEKEVLKVNCDEHAQELVMRQNLQDLNPESYQHENMPVVTELLTDQEREQEMLSKLTFVKEEARESLEIKNLTNLRNVKQEAKELHSVKKPASKKQSGKKKEKVSLKRGTYTAYSPEIRAEIGKFAAKYGSVKASQHFATILGHEVPESTARGLKDKYLKKETHKPVTSLGYSQRGRPLRLGKYDELVQECLKDIVRSGEKVSSFLVITTAKEILNKCEPDLLEENGGSVKLNTTWAKSFLKRIGVHNNS